MIPLISFSRFAATLAVLLLAPQAPAVPGEPAAGPLRLSKDNPRYFADGSGRVVYLTGSHTWCNLQDMGLEDPPPAFDFEAYLTFMERLHHNFIRLWRWELVQWDTEPNGRKGLHTCAPHPWARTGPGNALDGKPRFNLDTFDPAYFERLRSRVMAARDRGIYVSIMLFEGWGLQFVPDAFKAHPFHPDNNSNGLNGDRDGDGKALEIHTLSSPAVTAVEEAYVRHVIDAVNDLDNVLYEISNESHPGSTEWQYHMIRFAREHEKGRPRQHPIGMTFQYRGGSNAALFKSPADWISPNPEGGYRDDPPPADGSKAILADTDHLWGIGGDRPWVWKSFLRGLQPLFMDPYDGSILGSRFDPKFDPVRQALGDVRRLAESVNLKKMLPHPELASTGYCLAQPGREYLVYQPGPRAVFSVHLAGGRYKVEWIDGEKSSAAVTAVTAEATAAAATAATAVIDAPGGPQRFEPPMSGDAVLHLKGAADTVEDYFPPPESRGGWRVLTDPDAIQRLGGMDPDKLLKLREWLLQSDDRSFAAVVARHGHVVLEVERGRSSRADTGNVKSCAKAICATVLAIASEESREGRTPRKMSFDDPAFDFIPWAKPLSDPRKAKITVKQLLNHTSGLTPESGGAPNRGPWEWILGHTGDPKTARLAFDPGSDLDYSTHALYHAALVCEDITGMPYDRFAIENLLRPIGVESWSFEVLDGDAIHGRHPSHGLGTSARELARIAHCMLRGGRWRERQVIPKWFVDETAAPTHAVRGFKSFHRDAEAWSHGWELPARLTDGRGRGIPRDARFKPGSGGQLIAFIPSLDLVVTRQTGSSGDWPFEEYLRRCAEAAME